MKRNHVFMAVLVIMLALGFALSGCDSNGDSGGDADTWSLVTNANRSLINGTYSGSYSKTENLSEALGDEYDGSLGNIDGIRMTQSLNLIFTVNATAETGQVTMTQVYSFSGGNIAAIWPSIKPMMGEGGEGVTINDSNYSSTWFISESQSVISFPGDNTEINQNGTRIRMPLEGFGFSDPGYIVLNKQ